MAESQLVKCSWYGKDPYWGRVASELGIGRHRRSTPTRLTRRATATSWWPRAASPPPVDEAALAAYMEQERLEVIADLGLGDGTARILTNDLTHAYVDENMGTS